MEETEKTKDSRLVREFVVALPIELGKEYDWLALHDSRQYVAELLHEDESDLRTVRNRLRQAGQEDRQQEQEQPKQKKPKDRNHESNLRVAVEHRSIMLCSQIIFYYECNLRWLAAADAVNNGNSAAPAAGCKTLFHGALDMSLHRA